MSQPPLGPAPIATTSSNASFACEVCGGLGRCLRRAVIELGPNSFMYLYPSVAAQNRLWHWLIPASYIAEHLMVVDILTMETALARLSDVWLGLCVPK